MLGHHHISLVDFLPKHFHQASTCALINVPFSKHSAWNPWLSRRTAEGSAKVFVKLSLNWTCHTNLRGSSGISLSCAEQSPPDGPPQVCQRCVLVAYYRETAGTIEAHDWQVMVLIAGCCDRLMPHAACFSWWWSLAPWYYHQPTRDLLQPHGCSKGKHPSNSQAQNWMPY